LSFCVSWLLHFYNPLLIVEGQDEPGHATFQPDKQIFTQPAKITSLEHHSITMGINQSRTHRKPANFISSFA